MAIISIWSEYLRTTGTGPRHRVWHDGEVLIESTNDTFYDAARALIVRGGFDLDDTLQIVDRVTGKWMMRARLGWAAAHRISENESHGPRLVKWVPFDRPVE